MHLCGIFDRLLHFWNSLDVSLWASKRLCWPWINPFQSNLQGQIFHDRPACIHRTRKRSISCSSFVMIHRGHGIITGVLPGVGFVIRIVPIGIKNRNRAGITMAHAQHHLYRHPRLLLKASICPAVTGCDICGNRQSGSNLDVEIGTEGGPVEVTIPDDPILTEIATTHRITDTFVTPCNADVIILNRCIVKYFILIIDSFSQAEISGK